MSADLVAKESADRGSLYAVDGATGAFWRALVHEQIAIIRAHRANGTLKPHAILGLRLYLRKRREWRRRRLAGSTS